MMPNLSTPEGRKAWNESLKVVAETMRRDSEAFKAANGGLSATQLYSRRGHGDRFANSNVSGGGL